MVCELNHNQKQELALVSQYSYRIIGIKTVWCWPRNGLREVCLSGLAYTQKI